MDSTNEKKVARIDRLYEYVKNALKNEEFSVEVSEDVKRESSPSTIDECVRHIKAEFGESNYNISHHFTRELFDKILYHSKEYLRALPEDDKDERFCYCCDSEFSERSYLTEVKSTDNLQRYHRYRYLLKTIKDFEHSDPTNPKLAKLMREYTNEFADNPIEKQKWYKKYDPSSSSSPSSSPTEGSRGRKSKKKTEEEKPTKVPKYLDAEYAKAFAERNRKNALARYYLMKEMREKSSATSSSTSSQSS